MIRDNPGDIDPDDDNEHHEETETETDDEDAEETDDQDEAEEGAENDDEDEALDEGRGDDSQDVDGDGDGEESAGNEDDTSDSDEIIIDLDDEEDASIPAEEKLGIAKLRDQYRETKKQNKELQRQLEEVNKKSEPSTPLKRPKLDDVDIDYDEEKFEQKLLAFNEQQKKNLENEARRAKAEKEANDAYQMRLKNYNERKEQFKVKNFKEAEEIVSETLSNMQQGILIKAAKAPEQVVFVLGTDEKRREALASITDPIDFAIAIRELESKMTVKTNKTKAPPPPRKLTGGSGGNSNSTNSTLEKLREEAARTNDYTKVAAYKKEKKLKSRS